MKKLMTFLLLLPVLVSWAQIPDHVYQENIRTVKLYRYGDIYSYPILKLNSPDQLELHFDDLDADIKNCYYTYQHCNVDWTPSNLQTMDYIRGFQSIRITTYRNSSISFTRYTHYQAFLPDRNSVPVKSGNYLLKVFLDNDTSKLLFTKRFLVVDNRVAVAIRTLSPYNVQLLRTDQRIFIGVNTANAQINALSPQDLKLVVMQNNIWPTAAYLNRPSIYRGNYFEYNDDASTFPAGREWRWVDLRSMRLMSDRVQKIIDTSKRTEVYVKPDVERKGQIYVFYRDINGLYTVENMDGNNPYWQSDYGYTHFTFVPQGNQAYPGKDVYIYGELSNYAQGGLGKMEFNAEKGVYEGTLFLKQGYYNYTFVSIDANNETPDRFSFANTEGNFNITENNYTVLVYYRAFGARYDELLGFGQLSTLSPQ